jgi:NAD-dependent DNA ligase
MFLLEIKLIMYSQDNTKDEFNFKSLSKLYAFMNLYTAEKLIDGNSVELRYKIIVEE